jgi:hypothetical protein
MEEMVLHLLKLVEVEVEQERLEVMLLQVVIPVQQEEQDLQIVFQVVQ